MSSPRKPVYISFAGPPGCGKSPTAFFLSWNLNLPILSNDAIRTEVKENTLSSEKDSEKYKSLRDSRSKAILLSQKSFIYDAGVDRTWSRYKPELERHGYSYFLISFNLSEDFLARLAEAKGYTASKSIVDQWYADHQKFIDRYSADVGLVIDDKNYLSRVELSLSAVQDFIKTQ